MAGRSEQPVLSTLGVQAGKGPSQTDCHVRNATHKSDKPGCPPFLPSLLFPCSLSPSLPPTGVLFPSCHPSPTPVPGGTHPCSVPHLLSPVGRVPPPHPGTPPPRTHCCCLWSRRELGTFGCGGTGGAGSHVPFVLLAVVRQILHLSTFLKEPVLTWQSSPRLPSSPQHPHCPGDTVLQRLRMRLTAPQSSFSFERERELRLMPKGGQACWGLQFTF